MIKQVTKPPDMPLLPGAYSQALCPFKQSLKLRLDLIQRPHRGRKRYNVTQDSGESKVRQSSTLQSL